MRYSAYIQLLRDILVAALIVVLIRGLYLGMPLVSFLLCGGTLFVLQGLVSMMLRHLQRDGTEEGVGLYFRATVAAVAMFITLQTIS